MDSSMTEVFVSTDDVKVIGGTANVNVEVDFGPQGDRGNLFLVGYGHPETVTHSQTLQLLDIYINLQVGNSDYLGMYQYLNEAGVNTWVFLGPLITDKFGANRTVSFTNGLSTDVEFNISSILQTSILSGIDESKFNIQCTFSNSTKPVAHSIVVKPITIEAVTGDLVLPVSVSAAEFSGSAWAGLSGTYTVHFLITVV
jgi:hypothetical protein